MKVQWKYKWVNWHPSSLVREAQQKHSTKYICCFCSHWRIHSKRPSEKKRTYYLHSDRKRQMARKKNGSYPSKKVHHHEHLCGHAKGMIHIKNKPAKLDKLNDQLLYRALCVNTYCRHLKTTRFILVLWTWLYSSRYCSTTSPNTWILGIST